MVNPNSEVDSNGSSEFNILNSTLLKSLNAKSLFSTCSSAIQKIFYEQSIFFALNNQAIAEKYHQYKDLSWTQKFKFGTIKGLEKMIGGHLLIESLQFALRGVSSGKKASREPPTIFAVLVASVLEEILSRGIVQNCLAGSQKIAICITPQCLQNNRVFKWLTSPSARIISSNAMFAGLHLFNGGGYLSDKGAFIQATRIMLQSSEGISHETTGDIIAPIACHMTNNFLVWLSIKFLDKVYGPQLDHFNTKK